MRRKLYSTDFHYRLSKGNVTIVNNRDNPELTERFELMGAVEECLPELNDPIDQRERLRRAKISCKRRR
jgi:hypothetical protein